MHFSLFFLAALHDAQACKRMRQNATQLSCGNKKGEGKIPLEARSSGCLLHSALHATVCLPYEAQIFLAECSTRMR